MPTSCELVQPHRFPGGAANARVRWAVILLGMAVCLGPVVGRAQMVAWEINGTKTSVNTVRSATLLDSNLNSATLSLGAGVTATSSTDIYGGNGFSGASNLQDAITQNDYLAITINPKDGTTFSLSSISVDLYSNNEGFTVSLLSSATGITSSNALWSSAVGTTTGTISSIGLSSVADLQNLSSSTEFRFYAYGTFGRLHFADRTGYDIVVNGSTSAVPEPSTYAAMLGAVVLGAGVLRRRRRNAP